MNKRACWLSYNKRKCRVEKAGNAQGCVRCRSLGLSCSLKTSRNGVQPQSSKSKSQPHAPLQPLSPSHLPIQPTEIRDRLPSLHLQKELVALYFHEIHDTHHSIFHRPT